MSGSEDILESIWWGQVSCLSFFFHRIQDDGMFAKSDIPEKKCWESQLARSGLSITLRATPPGGWACPWTVITDAFQGVSP